MILKLSKEVYSYSKIKTAMDVYGEYAVIWITDEDGFWRLEFSDCKYETSLTVKEFENYLIGLENTKDAGC